jgi:hypothetical protein
VIIKTMLGIAIAAVAALVIAGAGPYMAVAYADSDFETGTCSEIAERVDVRTFSIDSTIVHSGTYSCRFQPGYGEGVLVMRSFPVLPGRSYRVRLWINITRGYVANNNDAYLWLQWQTGHGGVTPAVVLRHWIDVTPGWVPVDVVVRVPAGVVSAKLTFDCDRGLFVTNDQVITGYLDDIVIEGPLPKSIYLPLVLR